MYIPYIYVRSDIHMDRPQSVLIRKSNEPSSSRDLSSKMKIISVLIGGVSFKIDTKKKDNKTQQKPYSI